MMPDRRSDTTALGFALFAATTMIAQQVAGKATRDALFLSYFDVTNLPKVVIAAAIASMAGVLLMSRLLPRFGPFLLIPAVFGLSALLFLGEWVLLEFRPGMASVILYLHMAVFGAILISGFWSVINERFDPHSAKRRVARIAAAATFGGIIGGVLAERVSALLDVRTMLLFLSGLHLVCMAAVRAIGVPARVVQTEEPVKPRSAFEVIAHTRYLQWMAFLMVLVAIMAALLDYAFKAEASARFATSESLVAFFATFYAVVGALGFAIQTLTGPRVLQRYGIGATIAILPAVVAVFGTIGTAVTSLWTMVVLRGGHAVFVHSFYRSAFELLYTPLPRHKKRPTKTIIDVASDRFGDMLGSGLILLLLFLSPDLPTAVVAACAAVAAMAALYVVTRLNRGYIEQLASSLRKGAVRIEENEVVDATTQQILAETHAYSERDLLRAKIEAMEERQETEQADQPLPADDAMRFAATVADLYSGDANRIRRALNAPAMDIRLTPYLIPLLANDDVSEDIRTELRWMVPRIPGQLTDALLDPDQPLLARQRLPGVLEASHHPRSIEGLMRGLMDESFNIRYSCARTLARMRSRNAHLEIPRESVFDAIRNELDTSPEEWQSRNLGKDDEPAGAPDDARIDRNMEHVFTLLSLTLDRDAVHMSLQALFSADANLRGTALEYLENVLPDDLYAGLWQHIDAEGEDRGIRRSLADVVNELKSTVSHPGEDKER